MRLQSFITLSICSCIQWSLNYAYDPTNFDPRQADDQSAIVCEGPLPPFLLPRNPNRPTVTTLQQLCAQPQFGGLPAGFHSGGYCANIWEKDRLYKLAYDTWEEDRLYKIAYDIGPAAQTDRQLASPRLRAYCFQFCRCPALVSKWTLDKDNYYSASGKPPYIIRLDQPNQYWPKMNLIEVQGRILHTEIRFSLFPPSDPQGQVETLDLGEEAVDTYEYNKILCRDSYLDEMIPRPSYVVTYKRSFPNNVGQKVCAHALSGGDLARNVGGYCHKIQSIPEVTDVWFADEMTPFPSWHWNQGEEGVEIRYYCWQICHCEDWNGGPEAWPAERPRARLWQRLLSLEGPENSPYGKTSPADQGGASSSFSSSYTQAGSSSNNINRQCGSSCQGNADCKEDSESGEICRCRVAGPAFAKVASLDKVFFGALCMLTPTLNRVSLGGRGESLDQACPCNITYVSYSCCGSRDGLVFEDPSSRLGRLDDGL